MHQNLAVRSHEAIGSTHSLSADVSIVNPL